MGAKKQSFADILSGVKQREGARLSTKLPSWAQVPGIEIPRALNLEQCSSEVAAIYKAEIAVGIVMASLSAEDSERKADPSSFAIADLTGGLGVDSWAFARRFGRVLHNEMDVGLSAAVQRNFTRLGVYNVSYSQLEIGGGCPDNITLVAPGPGHGSPSSPIEALQDFKPDIIYLDPARRDAAGHKVFLLEDCSPDLLSIKDALLELCPDILVKVSPMADISMLANRLGSDLREIHIIGLQGECKELLCHLHRGGEGPLRISVDELSEAHASTYEFTLEDEARAQILLPMSVEELHQGLLFEPGAAMMKSGCRALLCSQAHLTKLGRSTHLYHCESAESLSSLAPFGKFYSIKEIYPLEARSLKSIGPLYPDADITARGIPMSSDELRSRMGIKGSGGVHIFGVTIDYSTQEPPRRYLIVCERKTLSA